MNPSLWRVSAPNIAVELRKLPGEFRAALRKRTKSKEGANASRPGPTNDDVGHGLVMERTRMLGS